MKRQWPATSNRIARNDSQCVSQPRGTLISLINRLMYINICIVYSFNRSAAMVEEMVAVRVVGKVAVVVVPTMS